MITASGTVNLTGQLIDLNSGITAAGQLVDLNAGTNGLAIDGGAIDTTGAAGAAGGAIDIDSDGVVAINSSLVTSGGGDTGAEGFDGGAETINTTGAGATITIGTVLISPRQVVLLVEVMLLVEPVVL